MVHQVLVEIVVNQLPQVHQVAQVPLELQDFQVHLVLEVHLVRQVLKAL
jgi:hypothetical protein